jgi:hypothetical protein
MPHCPECDRFFHNYQLVTRHLNDPRASCVKMGLNLVTIPKTAIYPSGEPYFASLAEDCFDNMDVDASPIEPGPPLPDLANNVNSSSNPEPSCSPLLEQYPQASSVWEPSKSTTFLDSFDRDKFAKQRQEHPYYPFASRGDWQMAAFLQRSGLSMAKINDFLSLEFVSYHFVSWPLYLKVLYPDSRIAIIVPVCQKTERLGRNASIWSSLEIPNCSDNHFY